MSVLGEFIQSNVGSASVWRNRKTSGIAAFSLEPFRSFVKRSTFELRVKFDVFFPTDLLSKL